MNGENLRALLKEKHGFTDAEADAVVDKAKEDFAKKQREPEDDGLSPMGVYEVTGCECAGVDAKIPWARTEAGKVCDHVGSKVACLKVTPWGVDRVRKGESHRALFMLEKGGRVVSLRIRGFAKAHTFEEIGSLADFFPS